MKILIISHEYPPVGGGGANACYHLSHEYASRGHEVHVVTVWYEGTELEETVRYEGTGLKGADRPDGLLSIHRIKSKRAYVDHSSFPELLDFLVKAYPVCMHLVKTRHFDVCHDFFAIPSGPIAYMLKKRFRLPYVVRFGGGDIPGAQKRFALIYKLIAPFERLIWKKADALVANSDGLKKRALGFYDKHEILIIPNGVKRVESSEVVHSETGIVDPGVAVKADQESLDTVNLLFVSRLIEGKGLQDIFPQMRTLNDRCAAIGMGIRFSVIGDGPYKDAYEQMVNDLGIEDLVVFHGQKTKPELPDFYENSDIFVFPSRSEGMPNAVLEAMIYGLPVVMTPCEGSKELIDGNGYVVPPEEFADRIYELIVDPDLRKRLGDESRHRAEELFSWTGCADRYLELFNGIRYHG